MSVQLMSWVFKHSPATLGSRLVLLVLADKANDDGTGAWPSVETISHEARLSERATQYALRRLERDGLIERAAYGPAGTINYSVRTDLGKFDELPALVKANASGPKSVNGSLDGSGAIHDTNERTDCTGGQNLHPRLRAV